MISSMTGFSAQEKNIPGLGQISVEIRSLNHKFLETVIHLPPGFLFLEDKIKKELEAKIKRGRVTLVVNLSGAAKASVAINQHLLQGYLSAINQAKKRFYLSGDVSMDTLIHLPGVLSLIENNARKENIWPKLKGLIRQGLDSLVKTRQEEGRALGLYLKKGAALLNQNLGLIKSRFTKVVHQRLQEISLDEERSSFLKESDINEEIERLSFYIHTFMHKLTQTGALGKELDFIAQEMQREANTMGAKSFDTLICGKAVQLKSQIEKLREQVQNIE